MHRICYFTIAAVHRKCDFINQLSSSFGSGGLSCSFNDKDLTQYITWKQKYFHRNQPSPSEKQGVLQLGKQPCFLDENGRQDPKDYIWLKNIPAIGSQLGREISLEEIACDIYQPTASSGALFKTLLSSLKSCL